MNEEHPLSEELKAVEAALASLKPRTDEIDRNRLLFAAGWEAALKQNNASAIPSKCHKRVWAWLAAFSGMSAVAASLFFLLLFRPASGNIATVAQNPLTNHSEWYRAYAEAFYRGETTPPQIRFSQKTNGEAISRDFVSEEDVFQNGYARKMRTMFEQNAFDGMIPPQPHNKTPLVAMTRTGEQKPDERPHTSSELMRQLMEEEKQSRTY